MSTQLNAEMSESLPFMTKPKNLEGYVGDVGGGEDRCVVFVEYEDGKKEDHALINGEHIADYIRRVDVPKSEFAYMLRSQQLRYLSVTPKRADKIKSIHLIKGKDVSSPIIMGVTIESR